MVDAVVNATKAELRRTLLTARDAVSPQRHEADALGLCEHLRSFIAVGHTVCAYVPVGSEPGSDALLDILQTLGATVLLPVADAMGSPLRWGEYVPGTLDEARFGLREPPSPWLPAEAVAQAATVLVPALAVDRAGVRLGRGAGFYDRTLPLASSSARLVAVVRDDELVDRLPAEPHDVRMTHALTPGGGVVALG